MAFIPSQEYAGADGAAYGAAGNRHRRERRAWLQLTSYPQSPYREMSAYGPDYLAYSKEEGFPYGYGDAAPAAGATGPAGAQGQQGGGGEAAAAAIGAAGQLFGTIFQGVMAGKTASKEMEHTQQMAEIESTLGAKRMEAESRLIAAQAKLAAVTKSHGPVIIGGIVTLGVLSGLGYWLVKRKG